MALSEDGLTALRRAVAAESFLDAVDAGELLAAYDEVKRERDEVKAAHSFAMKQAHQGHEALKRERDELRAQLAAAVHAYDGLYADALSQAEDLLRQVKALEAKQADLEGAFRAGVELAECMVEHTMPDALVDAASREYAAKAGGQ